jgi:hypothetical protein
VGLADADQENSLEYVREKLGSLKKQVMLEADDSLQIGKLGGRMVYVVF